MENYQELYQEYLEGFTLKEIAEKRGITEQAISQAFKRRGYKTQGPTIKRKYRGSEKAWEKHIKDRYGLSADWYQNQYNIQGGKCAVCGEDMAYKGASTMIDHNHVTGKIRGLLCRTCNSVRVGLLETYERFTKTELFVKTKEYITKHESI